MSLFGLSAAASEYGEANARVGLVTDTAKVEPGSTFLLGVQFDIKPGWHIYWRNPGEAGLATDIQWILAEGFKAGPFKWPLPISFDQSDGIPGYGYENKVLLVSEIQVSDSYDPDLPITISADVSWLACKGVCVLGSAKLIQELSQIPADPPKFRHWAANLPNALPTDRPPFTMTHRIALAEGNLNLWLKWDKTPTLVEWYPYPPSGLEVTSVRTQTRGGLTRIDAEVRALKNSEEPIDRFSSVVVITGEDGDRHGWDLNINLKGNSL